MYEPNIDLDDLCIAVTYRASMQLSSARFSANLNLAHDVFFRQPIACGLLKPNPQMNDNQFNDFPDAVEALVPTPTVNAAVTLYEGKLHFRSHGKVMDGEGRVEMSWLPYPAIRFHTTVVARSGFDFLDNDAAIEMVDCWPGVFVDVHPESPAIVSMEDRIPVSGIVSQLSCGDEVPVTSAIAHLVNFCFFKGDVIKNDAAAFCGRAELLSREWTVDLDEVHAGDSKKQLKATRGHAITHVARISRNDGAPFKLKDTKELIEALDNFASFARGQRCGVSIVVGLDDEGSQVSHIWKMPRVEGYRDIRNWFSDVVDNNLSDCFPGFMQRFEDVVWQKSIRDVIYWYLTATSSGVSIENGVVLAHIAFETLGWTLLVEDLKSLSSNGYDKINASDKLRLLLAQAKTPLQIPTELASLESFAKAENCQGGPDALALLRNAYVHPSPNSRKRLDRTDPQTQYQAWVLSMYYLELILLHLFDFNGEFSSRLVSGGWKGGEVRRVPWSMPSAPTSGSSATPGTES